MAEEHPVQEPGEAQPDPVEDELGEFDYMDPLKRDPDAETQPGLDPIIPPIPPEE
jgi:hypothetical protein